MLPSRFWLGSVCWRIYFKSLKKKAIEIFQSGTILE